MSDGRRRWRRLVNIRASGEQSCRDGGRAGFPVLWLAAPGLVGCLSYAGVDTEGVNQATALADTEIHAEHDPALLLRQQGGVLA